MKTMKAGMALMALAVQLMSAGCRTAPADGGGFLLRAGRALQGHAAVARAAVVGNMVCLPCHLLARDAGFLCHGDTMSPRHVDAIKSHHGFTVSTACP